MHPCAHALPSSQRLHTSRKPGACKQCSPLDSFTTSRALQTSNFKLQTARRLAARRRVGLSMQPFRRIPLRAHAPARLARHQMRHAPPSQNRTAQQKPRVQAQLARQQDSAERVHYVSWKAHVRGRGLALGERERDSWLRRHSRPSPLHHFCPRPRHPPPPLTPLAACETKVPGWLWRKPSPHARSILSVGSQPPPRTHKGSPMLAARAGRPGILHPRPPPVGQEGRRRNRGYEQPTRQQECARRPRSELESAPPRADAGI